MTRYRLPEVLGGGEYEAHIDDGRAVIVVFDLPDYGRIALRRERLTEVKSALPPEPPDGSVVRIVSLKIGRFVAERDDSAPTANGEARWYATCFETVDPWAALADGATEVTLLVPDPLAEAPELPWRSDLAPALSVEPTDELRARPGQWAAIAEGIPTGTAGARSARIRRGVGAWAPAGSFEARCVGSVGGSAKLYARYVGGAS